MALLDIPPWLNVQPNYFTSALEAGAHAGLALGEQAQRAQQLAEARAERQAQAQERADRAAQQQQQFEESQLLNMQKLSQDYAQLQQQTAHQNAMEAAQAAQESRLLNYQTGLLDYDKGRLAVENKRANLANKLAESPIEYNPAVPGGSPAYFRNPRTGGVSIVPASVSGPQHKLGENIPVPDPVTGELLGSVITTGPTTGHFEAVKGQSLTPNQQAAVQSTRARILQAQLRDAVTAPFADSKARDDYMKVRRDALQDVNDKLEKLQQSIGVKPAALAPRTLDNMQAWKEGGPTVLTQPSTNLLTRPAPATNNVPTAVFDTKTGKWRFK